MWVTEVSRYAEHVSSKAKCEYSFAEFREMQSDTGVSYNFQDVVVPSSEELLFLRTYMMAVDRVKEELRQAVNIPCTLAAVKYVWPHVLMQISRGV